MLRENHNNKKINVCQLHNIRPISTTKKSFRNSAVALCYHLYRRIYVKKPLSATALNKIRHRNYLPLEMDSTLAVSTVPPRIEK